MGDRWRPQQLGGSRYIWYPMVWGNNNLPTIVPADVWRVDFGTGAHIVAAGTTYEAERGTLLGPARLLNNTGFSGGTAVGYIGVCYCTLRFRNLSGNVFLQGTVAQ
jgi:hypothetical protein